MPLTWIIYIAAAITPFAAYGYGVAKTKITMRGEQVRAVKSARADEQAQCRIRLADIEQRINDEAAKRIKSANAEPEVPTPGQAELANLCAKSASCRERK